ncbi:MULTISPECIES: hypothetical protein [Halorussus]|uniref:DUF7847 domain-containing protein n=1 Tax=Halorussus TaxID=1070314 RepID=UPI00209F257A|nr:hypothetical protein [Halorussus vallis]USZ76026.1 hypothetical protein NGM07_01580 [Halorussus vallis]
MGVRSSISATLDALKRNPVMFVAAFLVSLVGSATLLAQLSLEPGVASIVVSVLSFLVQFVALFFVGGAYAMAAEALDGRTGFGTLVSGGTENYLSLLGATLLLVGVTMATFIAVGMVAIVVVLGVVFGGGGGSFGTYLAGVGLIYLLGFLPMFLLQFYGPAVVVSDRNAIGSIKQSYRLVRRNLLSTLGFDVVALVLGLLGSAPTVWLYATRFDALVSSDGTFTPLATLDSTAVAGYLVATVVLSTLFGGFFYTYQVAFYEDLVERTEGSGGEPSVADEPTTGDDAFVGGDR